MFNWFIFSNKIHNLTKTSITKLIKYYNDIRTCTYDTKQLNKIEQVCVNDFWKTPINWHLLLSRSLFEYCYREIPLIILQFQYKCSQHIGTQLFTLVFNINEDRFLWTFHKIFDRSLFLYKKKLILGRIGFFIS